MHTGETRGPKKTQEVYGWAVKKALCVLLNWIISRTCSSNRVCPSAGGPHAGSQHFSYLRSSSFQRPAAKRGNMEPRGNDLLKEFFPARKRIKSLPPVINQITEKSLGTSSREKEGKLCSISVSSLWLPGGISLQPALSWRLCSALPSIFHNFLSISILLYNLNVD